MLLLPLFLLDPTTASATGFGIASFDGQLTADPGGDPFTQAGGHPHQLQTTIRFNTELDPELGYAVSPGDPMDVDVELPPGLIGTPTLIPPCSLEAFFQPFGPRCDPGSMVGVARVATRGYEQHESPIYLLRAAADTSVTLAFKVANVQAVAVRVLPRTDGDSGLTLAARRLSQGIRLEAAKIELWGVPGDPGHDADRCRLGGDTAGCAGGELPADGPPSAFLTMPTRCTEVGVGLETRIRARSWQQPSRVVSASFFTHLPPGDPAPAGEWGPQQGPTGCENVPLEPRFSAAPTTSVAGAPTGFSVELSIPQETLVAPEAIAQSHLRKAEVTLPLGMTANIASADGLRGCGAAEIGLRKEDLPSCPDAAKIGDIEIDTPLLERTLTGSVYLAEPGDNPFGSVFGLYAVAVGPGFVVKLPGRVDPDLRTGQLVVSFDRLPQLPFSRLQLRLKSGGRALLANPRRCGTHVTEAKLVPWSGGPPVVERVPFQIGGEGEVCRAGRLAPRLVAGSLSPLAGAYSPFAIRLTRPDGSEELGRLEFDLPRGLATRLAGVATCSEAALAAIPTGVGSARTEPTASTCPAASQVATVTVAAGVGATPFYLRGSRVYLTGPYKGAPLGLAIVVPALAGPFDLGNVVVRVALDLDPDTAQVSARGEPLPAILAGVPLNLRMVELLTEPGFLRNPTGCEPRTGEVRVMGGGDEAVALQYPFQVGDCARLGLRPRLSLRFLGPSHRSARPKLRVVLRPRVSDASLRRVSLTLPSTELLASGNIRAICSRAQYVADLCPTASIVGQARAWSPLLDEPLQGPVYLRASHRQLPDLVAALGGRVRVDLVGAVDSVRGRVRGTFGSLPDLPISKFALTLAGGKRGLLVHNTEVCGAARWAGAGFVGQNGKRADSQVAVKADCGRKGRAGSSAVPRRRPTAGPSFWDGHVPSQKEL